MPGDEESLSDEAIWETLPVSLIILCIRFLRLVGHAAFIIIILVFVLLSSLPILAEQTKYGTSRKNSV